MFEQAHPRSLIPFVVQTARQILALADDEGRPHLVGHSLKSVLEYLLDHMVLVSIVPVEGCAVDHRLSGDILHGDMVKASPLNKVNQGVLYENPGSLRAQVDFFLHQWVSSVASCDIPVGLFLD